jgi:hypothetical protein
VTQTAEDQRLHQARTGQADWRQWGPYLSDRQWGTVREDYSPGGTAWDYLPHDHARSRAYRWGEDGIGGISDLGQTLCFALALWNGRDPILKERFFGLTNDQGNHGEDVKDYYFYLDNTPTHSWMRMLYRYPQGAFPYADLLGENARRKSDPALPEYELVDTGIFDGDRYFDVTLDYAKRTADDILIRITVANRGPEAAPIWLLPTLWFRNTWSWGDAPKPRLWAEGDAAILTAHPDRPAMRLDCPGADALLFCENETNTARLWGQAGPAWPKDGINDHIVSGAATVNPAQQGTKAAALWHREVPAGGTLSITLRLSAATSGGGLGPDPAGLMATRLAEADAFYAARLPPGTSPDRARIARQAHAGMLWSKQFFHYVVADWLEGDRIPPPGGRERGRNHGWRHVHASDVISMPDTWEYPWFASWDLCFHTVVLARTDLDFAKEQVLLLMREWYMHPNGQVPAYEWAFDDVNPPLQVWAGLQIAEYEQRTTGRLDTAFLRRLLDHGLLYFTWWVNRKDAEGNNLFQGGFLGLDNISVFDRSSGYLPGGGRLYQSDGTTWAGFFALQMMQAAMLLARVQPDHHELAAKFFQHFALIADAMDHLGRESQGSADLWDEADGLYYDVLRTGDRFVPLKVRSLVSLLPMIAVADLDLAALEASDNPAFAARIAWFRRRQADLFGKIAGSEGQAEHRLLVSLVDRDRLQRLLRVMLDPAEMLSDYGIRSLSHRHLADPFRVEIGGDAFGIGYWPAESQSGLFGGNSNWRGPIWMPVNVLLIDALRRHHRHYGEAFTVECPVGSGRMMTLDQVADELARRLVAIFEAGQDGRRPVWGGAARFQQDPGWRDTLLFYEYFHGDNGAGIGAAHQTGWTGLVAVLIEDLGRAANPASAPARRHAKAPAPVAAGR